jgi:membrane-associated protein
VNYWLGKTVGLGMIRKWHINQSYIDRTQKFYERHGGKTIIIARFVPIIRTFAPFVAGIGRMNYFRFMSYNIFGGLLWTSLLIFAGYFFGNIPFVKKHFSIVIAAIIVISVIPVVIEFIRAKFGKEANKSPS